MNRFWYFKLIHKYIPETSEYFPNYIVHVSLVTSMALDIARRLELSAEQLQFIEEAAMLHDIGVCQVDGSNYIQHGVKGAAILTNEGYPKHARVAETHTGVGIFKEQILEQKLPLILKDYVPETVEEEIISFADLFYSKSNKKLYKKASVAEVRTEVAKYGPKSITILESWLQKYD